MSSTTTKELIYNSFENNQEIISSYIFIYKSLDDQEKEIRLINQEINIKLFSNLEERELNMDLPFALQILELKTIADMKNLIIQQLTSYIYSLLVLQQSMPFYDTLSSFLIKSVKTSPTEMVDSQAGGGLNLKTIIFSFMSLTMIQSTLGFNADLATLDPTGNIGVSLHTKTERIPNTLVQSMKIISDFNIKDIDIENPDEIDEFIKLFTNTNPILKTTNTIKSENLTEKYKHSYDLKMLSEKEKKVSSYQLSSYLAVIGLTFMDNEVEDVNKVPEFEKYMNSQVIQINDIAKKQLKR
jgi:hypothetical protein